jgi:Leucine-rich repeat (LRR) protein
VLAGSSGARQLSSLVLSRCKLGTRGLQALCTGTFDSLSELDISNNHIGVLGGTALANASFLRRLDVLDLGNNRLEDRGVAAVAAALAPSELKQLNLRANRCGSAAAEALAALSLPLLEELNLSSNSIGVPGIRALAGSEALPSLARLDVRSNNLAETERAMLRKELGRTFGRL